MSKKWLVYAAVGASKFIGEVEADTKEEAEEKAEQLAAENPPMVCHHCSSEVEDPQINSIEVSEA